MKLVKDIVVVSTMVVVRQRRMVGIDRDPQFVTWLSPVGRVWLKVRARHRVSSVRSRQE